MRERERVRETQGEREIEKERERQRKAYIIFNIPSVCGGGCLDPKRAKIFRIAIQGKEQMPPISLHHGHARFFFHPLAFTRHITNGHFVEFAPVKHGSSQVVRQRRRDRRVVEKIQIQHSHKRRVACVPMLPAALDHREIQTREIHGKVCVCQNKPRHCQCHARYEMGIKADEIINAKKRAVFDVRPITRN